MAERRLSSGAGCVLIASGSRAVGRDARVRVPAPAVRGVDTVGAGDAFTAGVLAHLHRTGRLGRAGVDHLGACELARLLSHAVEIGRSLHPRRRPAAVPLRRRVDPRAAAVAVPG
ncbi:PfkB family carbohydrate kinase [Streptomyces coeruleorubidus]|uniref:PfkB family carbohydrate kinase n=1 Tax=Streptomyces coeruleorubidus TaxID=116188 RepID=UPI0037BCEF1D